MTVGSWTSRDVRDARELSMRIYLGLNPAHDIFEALRVLHDEGREAFERMRGERCEWAHEWKPPTDKWKSIRSSIIEECAKVVEKVRDDFLSVNYAGPHPASSFVERFACDQVATAIRSLNDSQSSQSKPTRE